MLYRFFLIKNVNTFGNLCELMGSFALLVAHHLEQLNEQNLVCSWAEGTKNKFTSCVLWAFVCH